jgi:hypothetical protein
VRLRIWLGADNGSGEQFVELEGAVELAIDQQLLAAAMAGIEEEGKSALVVGGGGLEGENG